MRSARRSTISPVTNRAANQNNHNNGDTNMTTIPATFRAYVDLVTEATGQRPHTFRITKVMKGGVLDGLVVEDFATVAFEVGRTYRKACGGGSYTVTGCEVVIPS